MLPDHGPGDFVVALSCGLHCMPCHVIERYHVGQDAHCLVEGAEPKKMDTQMSDPQWIVGLLLKCFCRTVDFVESMYVEFHSFLILLI